MESAYRKNTPFVVPIFIPHAGCPHRCLFCDQCGTTGRSAPFPSTDSIHQHITEFLSYRRDESRFTEISFYGGNFLGLPPERIRLLLATVLPYIQSGQADGIRFSTRPDTIDEERLNLVADYPVTTIEIGVQSMQDEVLQTCRRGHTAEDTRRAVALLKAQPYRLGLQMMVGLPGDTPISALATGRELAAMGPDFVRIYPTVVLKGSPLAQWHAQGRFQPMALDAAVELVATLYLIFARHHVAVVRMGLQATTDLSPGADLVCGPFHPAFGELVRSALWLEALRRHLEKEKLRWCELVLEIHPRLLSQVKGQKDANIVKLIDSFALSAIEVRADEQVPEDAVRVNGRQCHYWE